MLLKEWLEARLMTATELATILDVQRSYMFQIVKGVVSPGKRVAKYIMDYTNDEVTAEDLGIHLKTDRRARMCPHCNKRIDKKPSCNPTRE